ncbi:TetR/AcrR family transcriptional regulator [Catenuloplanes indicus]|uniref:AcrR family transcriptional regulator n=1 Tax=Catenuloplanes indicus TaxID=137267 RepID=A0AAE3VY63_9ACTN|nr:TetR/AcrR family transcriptional regulator [Catenuloplanes indicus]MDQ0366021.1 AcrR family transcriptional regulator [Catenuloplanes indicus]
MAPTDDEVRELVLNAADRLYYTRGIQAVGMDALRTESGVPLKRLYRLFPAKEAIVEAVLRRRHERWTRRFDDAVNGTPTTRGRLLAVYDVLAHWFDEDDFRGCLFINAFGELGTASPRVAEIVRAHKAECQARLAELCAAAGAPAWLAPQLAILSEGAQTTAAIAGTNAAAGHARAAAVTLIDAALGEEAA